MTRCAFRPTLTAGGLDGCADADRRRYSAAAVVRFEIKLIGIMGSAGLGSLVDLRARLGAVEGDDLAAGILAQAAAMELGLVLFAGDPGRLQATAGAIRSLPAAFRLTRFECRGIGCFRRLFGRRLPGPRGPRLLAPGERVDPWARLRRHHRELAEETAEPSVLDGEARRVRFVAEPKLVLLLLGGVWAPAPQADRQGVRRASPRALGGRENRAESAAEGRPTRPHAARLPGSHRGSWRRPAAPARAAIEEAFPQTPHAAHVVVPTAATQEVGRAHAHHGAPPVDRLAVDQILNVEPRRPGTLRRPLLRDVFVDHLVALAALALIDNHAKPIAVRPPTAAARRVALTGLLALLFPAAGALGGRRADAVGVGDTQEVRVVSAEIHLGQRFGERVDGHLWRPRRPRTGPWGDARGRLDVGAEVEPSQRFDHRLQRHRGHPTVGRGASTGGQARKHDGLRPHQVLAVACLRGGAAIPRGRGFAFLLLAAFAGIDGVAFEGLEYFDELQAVKLLACGNLPRWRPEHRDEPQELRPREHAAEPGAVGRHHGYADVLQGGLDQDGSAQEAHIVKQLFDASDGAEVAKAEVVELAKVAQVGSGELARPLVGRRPDRRGRVHLREYHAAPAGPEADHRRRGVVRVVLELVGGMELPMMRGER